MGILKILFIILLLSFPVGELLRFQLIPGVVMPLNDVVVGITSIYGFYFVVKERKKLNVFLKPILLFVFLCTFSLLINSFRITTNEIFVSSLYLLRWISYTMLFLLCILFDKNFKKVLLWVSLFSGIVFVLIGYVQYAFYQNLRNLYHLGWDDHLYRLFSSFLDPNFAGIFLSLLILLLLTLMFFFWEQGKKKTAGGFLVLTGLSLGALFLTYSRSSLIAFICAVGLLFVLKKKAKFLILIAFVFFLYLLLIQKDFNTENINLFRIASSEARLKTMQDGVKIALDHPVFGIGFNTYKYAQIEYGFRKKEEAEKSHADAGADNSLLFVLATTGIVGLLAFLNIWRVLIVLSFKQWKKQSKNMFQSAFPPLLIATIVAVFINSQFINSWFYIFIMEWVWIIAGLTFSKKGS